MKSFALMNNDYYDVIFVSGFGASEMYSKKAMRKLQYITGLRVLNYPLKHGLTLEQEVQFLEKFLPSDKHMISKITLIGFSTGCYVCLFLANKFPGIKKIILCNPAEIVTRITKSALVALCPDWNVVPYLQRVHSVVAADKKSKTYWAVIFMMVSVVWFICIHISPMIMSYAYYHAHGKHVNEPYPAELQCLLFQLPFSDVRITLMDCLIKTDFHALFRKCEAQIHILVGADDFYLHFSMHLAEVYHSKVTLHKTMGDHHYLYHYPDYSAKKLAALVVPLCKYL